MTVRGYVTALVVGALLGGCATVPEGTYFPPPSDPATGRMGQILHRAALAGGDDPARYSFAFIKSPVVSAYSDEDATFYFTDGLMRLPAPMIEAVVAHEVAHEVMGHIGTRRKLALSLTAGFGVLGIAAPGLGLFDFLINPLVVRAFDRQQELEADQKAVEILRAMGHPAPRRSLAEALRAVDGRAPKQKEQVGGLLATHPDLDERLAALEPAEPAPAPVARARARP